MKDKIIIERCPVCGSNVAGNEGMQVAAQFQKFVDDAEYRFGGSWDFWASKPEGFTLSCGELRDVRLIAKNVHFQESQGDERAAFMIFDVGGVALLRKDGTADSYGEVSWTFGHLRPVTRVEKTITTFYYE